MRILQLLIAGGLTVGIIAPVFALARPQTPGVIPVGIANPPPPPPGPGAADDYFWVSVGVQIPGSFPGFRDKVGVESFYEKSDNAFAPGPKPRERVDENFDIKDFDHQDHRGRWWTKPTRLKIKTKPGYRIIIVATGLDVGQGTQQQEASFEFGDPPHW